MRKSQKEVVCILIFFAKIGVLCYLLVFCIIGSIVHNVNEGHVHSISLARRSSALALALRDKQNYDCTITITYNGLSLHVTSATQYRLHVLSPYIIVYQRGHIVALCHAACS